MKRNLAREAAAVAAVAAAWGPSWAAATGERVKGASGGAYGTVFIIVDVVLAALLIGFVMKKLRGRAPENPLSADRSHPVDQPEVALVTDPVCGRRFEKKDALDYAISQGRTAYFCSEDCRTKYRKDPARYESKLMVEV